MHDTGKMNPAFQDATAAVANRKTGCAAGAKGSLATDAGGDSPDTVSRAGKSVRKRRRRKSAGMPVVTIPAPAYLERKLPAYSMLDEDVLDRIEKHTDWILQEVGIEVRNDPVALSLFKDAGASIQGERVRFERGLVRALCSTAPKQFTMQSRQPGKSIEFGGDSVILAPAYGPPFVTDMQKGRRYATLEDFQNFMKLTYMSEALHHQSGTVCEPVDVPVNKRHLDMLYAHMRYSNKPFMGSVTAPERARDSIDMARILFGADYLEHNVVIQGNINVNSPLVFDETMTGVLRAYAEAGQGLVISPFILGGAMSPVTTAAMVAQAHAEALAGIALSQLVRPGTAVVYGSFLTTMDLKTGAPTFGTPESNLACFAISQLCQRVGVPFRCGGHLTASKTADAQAMLESVNTMYPALMAGANFIFQAAGWLEGGLTIGYEKFLMDVDQCAAIARQVDGLLVNDDTLAASAFVEVGPGSNFLGARHTLQHFRTANYRSELCDNKSFEQWTEDGSLSMEERAHNKCRQMLSDYELPDMDVAIDEALLDFIERKKSALPDKWH